MVNASESAAKEEWVATVTQLLLGIEQALSADSSGSILKESSSSTGLTRLTNNLIQVTYHSFLQTCPFFIAHQISCKLGTPRGCVGCSGCRRWVPQVVGHCALPTYLPGAGWVWGVGIAEHWAHRVLPDSPSPRAGIRLSAGGPDVFAVSRRWSWGWYPRPLFPQPGLSTTPHHPGSHTQGVVTTLRVVQWAS